MYTSGNTFPTCWYGLMTLLMTMMILQLKNMIANMSFSHLCLVFIFFQTKWNIIIPLHFLASIRNTETKINNHNYKEINKFPNNFNGLLYLTAIILSQCITTITNSKVSDKQLTKKDSRHGVKIRGRTVDDMTVRMYSSLWNVCTNKQP